MTKSDIVQRLLDSKQITAEEAVVLLSTTELKLEKNFPIQLPAQKNPNWCTIPFPLGINTGNALSLHSGYLFNNSFNFLSLLYKNKSRPVIHWLELDNETIFNIFDLESNRY